MNKLIKPPYGGVFFTTDENGRLTDKGIVDEMLENEVQIRADLIKLEIIKEFKGRMLLVGEDDNESRT